MRRLYVKLSCMSRYGYSFEIRVINTTHSPPACSADFHPS